MPDRGNEKRALAALVLTGGFMAIEIAGGLLSGSLALFADAGHMLTDPAALALAYVAIRAARTPETARLTFGQHRLQVLAALVNGAAPFGITIWIAVEAVGRLLAPVAGLGGAVLGGAGGGVVGTLGH